MVRLHKILLVFALLAACGGDEVTNNATPTCPQGTSYNPILAECVRLADGNNNIGGMDSGGPADAGETMPDASESPDVAPMPELGCQTDNDGDGAFALECGGDDCDDTNPRRAPGLAEVCDEFDNDCDEEVNEDVMCSILAHSDTRLYRVDFFAGTYVDLGATVTDLWDIDTHPDGTTYGIAGDRLFRYDENNGTWNPAPGSLGFLETPNGFCIDNEGNAYLTSTLTLRSVDLVQGTSAAIGSLFPTTSSGDCVVNKGGILFMTSSHTTPDSFVRLSGANGSSMVVGQTGHDSIWGLTAAYNRVFGLTAEGNVVEISVADGSTTIVASFPELSFYGAASTPGR